MKYFKVLLFTLIVGLLISTIETSFAQTSTHNIAITVSSNSVLTDAALDSAAGINPTLNQSVSIAAEVGTTDVTDTSTFRVRANDNTWMLANFYLGGDPGISMITNNDVQYTFLQTTGSLGMAGSFVPPFPGPVTLATLINMTIATGSAKTSTARGSPIGSNSNNYVQFSVTTTIPRDYFFEVDLTPYFNQRYDFTAP